MGCKEAEKNGDGTRNIFIMTKWKNGPITYSNWISVKDGKDPLVIKPVGKMQVKGNKGSVDLMP